MVFTADGGARLLSEALKAGVKGYVRKDSPSADLIRAIEAAHGGEFYVDPGLSSTIVLEEGDRTLSARQREILQMLADGMQTDHVAKDLGSQRRPSGRTRRGSWRSSRPLLARRPWRSAFATGLIDS